jgi:hypothetical protein
VLESSERRVFSARSLPVYAIETRVSKKLETLFSGAQDKQRIILSIPAPEFFAEVHQHCLHYQVGLRVVQIS